MNAPTAAMPVLITLLWPRRHRGALRDSLLALGGSLALWASAKMQVPFYPVPMTLQTLVLLVIGMVYGWRLGMATVALYLAAGAAGLPVFAGTPEKGLGLFYMTGPTGGYLLGFVLAVGVCGYLAERGWDRRAVTVMLAMVAGNALIYLPGLLWLGWLLGWGKPVLQWGFLPFLPGDLLKLFLAAALLPTAWRWFGKRHERQGT